MLSAFYKRNLTNKIFKSKYTNNFKYDESKEYNS